MKNITDVLSSLGLTNNQARIYLALLDLGTASVKQVAKKTGFQRPNLYDVLEELKEKGLATYIQKGKASYYTAVDPEELSNMLKEKQALLESVMPMLKESYNFKKEEVSVQVYKGQEGIKSSLNKVFNYPGTTIYGINIAGQLRAEMPVFAKQFFRRRKESKIKLKAIYTTNNVTDIPDIEARFQKSESYNPTVTQIYEDVVLIHIYKPLLIGIEIKSRPVAEAFMKYFDTLWKNASKIHIK